MIEVFGWQSTLRKSTSPVPGKTSLAVVAPEGHAWTDVFLWDPVSGLLEWDQAKLEEVLFLAKRAQSPIVMSTLRSVEGLAGAVRWVRRVFSGSYGGSLGFGRMGSVVAMTSALMGVVMFLVAGVLLAPLIVIAWWIRLWINSQIRQEQQRVLAQVQELCKQLA
jgi:hypothetical protein